LVLISSASYAQITGPLPNLLSDGLSFVPPDCVDFPPTPQPDTTVIRREVLVPNINTSPVSFINVGIRFWRVKCSDENTIIAADFENIDDVNNAIPGITRVAVNSPSGSSSAGAFEYVANEFTNTGSGFPSQLIRNWWSQDNIFSPPLILTRNTFTDFTTGFPDQPIDINDIQGEIEVVGQGQQGFSESFTIPPASEMTAVEPDNSILTGRYSGNWVVENTADQGILVSVSELPNRSLVLFMAWFTFDSEGNPAWFTGNAFFEQGDSIVNFNLIKATGGSFNQDIDANRQTVGSATLQVIECGRLRFSFDLTAEGLDNDIVNLVRLFAGETAGYTCRDIQSRVDESLAE